jgi:hypothetical protein
MWSFEIAEERAYLHIDLRGVIARIEPTSPNTGEQVELVPIHPDEVLEASSMTYDLAVQRS